MAILNRRGVALELYGIVFLFFVSILMLGFLFIEHSITDETARYFHVWAQFFTGPWPRWEEGSVNRKSLGFSVGVVFRILLVMVPIAGVVDILRRIIALEKEQTMKFLDILRLRDRTIKNELIREVPVEDREKARRTYDKAFEESSKRFTEDHLKDLVGEKRAQKIIKTEFNQ